MAKILIADTNEEFLCAMYELLCRQNAVQTCANGVRTLELLESFRPDHSCYFTATLYVIR